MPHDAALVAETRAWFLRAQEDLATAEMTLRAVPPLRSIAAYHVQQAVEKALKGFLVWHAVPFRKTHSLEEIGEQCLEIDDTLHDLVDRAVPLTAYAWRFRYPGEPEEPSRDEAAEAVGLAREVYGAILARLPADVRP